eukprot:1159358-Pelagomonas_calceolata.AAC.1
MIKSASKPYKQCRCEKCRNEGKGQILFTVMQRSNPHPSHTSNAAARNERMEVRVKPHPSRCKDLIHIRATQAVALQGIK